MGSEASWQQAPEKDRRIEDAEGNSVHRDQQCCTVKKEAAMRIYPGIHHRFREGRDRKGIPGGRRNIQPGVSAYYRTGHVAHERAM